MSIQLSEKQFKNSAKRLKEIMNKNTGDIGYNQALQFLSQSLFDKPFEEIKATIFNQSKGSQFVLILHYGSESILSHNGNFISQLNIGAPSEISLDLLISTGKNLSSQLNTDLKHIYFPEILGDEWEVYDVINLAEKFGYFTYEKTIISCLEEASVILLNGHRTYTIDGDWEEQIVNEMNEGENPIEHCIWHSEYINDDYDKFEHFFNLKEILSAKPKDDDFSTWLMTDESGKTHTIHFIF